MHIYQAYLSRLKSIISLSIRYSLPVVLFPKAISAFETDGIRHITTQIMFSHSVVAGDLNRDVVVLDAIARAGTTALKLSKDVASRSTRPVLERDVVDVELAGIASAGGVVVAGALRDGKDAGSVDELEVGHCDVGCIAEATSSSVRRLATLYARPSLEVSGVTHSVVDGDVAD